MKYTVPFVIALLFSFSQLQAQQARLQVIHNAADPGAAVVDLYVNGSMFVDDFAFRDATAFGDVPAGVQLSIGVAPGNSTSAGDIITTFDVTLDAGKSYIAVANGVLNPANFAANPDMKDISFTLFSTDMALESGSSASDVDLKVLHGATDAPAVDVIARGVGTLVDDAAYGDMTPYITVAPASYTLDITPASDNSTIVASFTADVSGLAGGAGIVFASGFLSPSNNQNGEAFGLFAALPDGTVIALPAAAPPQARLQVIHNAADPAAATVDIYLNGSLLLDDFAFRAATPFIDVDANTPLEIGVAPSTSTSANDIIATIPVKFDAGKTYIAVANGVLNPASFAANPDMKDISFTLFTTDMARESGMNASDVDLKVLHGATDAPTVDVIARGVGTLVDDAAYGDMTDYFSVPADSYTLDITPGNDNKTIVASFSADLSSLGGGAGIVLASGFLAPSHNQQGPAFGLFAVLPDGTVIALPEAAGPQARMQIIHNAADPAAEEVDIYVNSSLFINDLAFRAATPFVDVPAGVSLSVGVAPSNSTSAGDIIATFNLTLEAGKTYIAVANGVLDPANFAANPDMNDIAFTLFTTDMGRESGMDAGQVDLKVLHGATDAPAVDVIARGVGTLVDDAAYGDMTDYFSVPADSYMLDITPANDNNTVVATFAADLSGLGGGAAVVFASGFLSPMDNQDGEAFGLFAALPNGNVVTLAAPEPAQARLQVIHNAADPAAAVVDIYLDDALLLDDFAFRTATPFVDVPAEQQLAIGIAPGSSTSVNDVIATINVEFEDGMTYVAVANGVLNPANFAANPDMKDIAFTLISADDGRESGMDAGQVDLKVLHGATDAPAVDVLARDVATLVDDAAYGDFTAYFSVPAASYTLDITPANDNSTIVASYTADLSGLGGGAAVVFASGFLSPMDNQDGEAFGLYAALPDGTVIALPAAVDPMARLQVIHNAADPAAAVVDIYLDDALLLDDFAFRAATPFVDVPAEQQLAIGIAPGSSMSVNDVIATINVEFENGKTYIAVANGVLNPASFSSNPDMKDIAFTLISSDDGRESGMDAGQVDLKVLHGATDAPAVDVIARDVATLVDDAAYGDFTAYFSVPAASYTLDITPANDNGTIVASFTADLSGLGGGAAVVFASGFLSPMDNQDGEAFGLYAALPDGTVLPLSSVTSVERDAAPLPVNAVQAYPNPARDQSNLAFSIREEASVQLMLYDMTGRMVYSIDRGQLAPGNYNTVLNTAQLTPGMYHLVISTGDAAASTTLSVVR